MIGGSSLRMRGTHSAPTLMPPTHGIIPAYAGNTSTAMWASACSRDHPRVCGEHEMRLMVCFIPRGSSPRMRGTRPVFLLDRLHDGIIPAYAGNTEASVSWVCGDGDHPRVCGEHIPAIISSIRNAGSSPRMRGTPLSGEDAFGRVGIIPAYAGNTRSMKSGIGLCGDHPRVCGEHRFIGSNKYRAVGSSPRMRGTQVRRS